MTLLHVSALPGTARRKINLIFHKRWHRWRLSVALIILVDAVKLDHFRVQVLALFGLHGRILFRDTIFKFLCACRWKGFYWQWIGPKKNWDGNVIHCRHTHLDYQTSDWRLRTRISSTATLKSLARNPTSRCLRRNVDLKQQTSGDCGSAGVSPRVQTRTSEHSGTLETSEQLMSYCSTSPDPTSDAADSAGSICRNSLSAFDSWSFSWSLPRPSVACWDCCRKTLG